MPRLGIDSKHCLGINAEAESESSLKVADLSALMPELILSIASALMPRR